MKHIAFTLEQAYGHILPTLGIAIELIRRGHRVSYAVTRDFAPGISRIGARALVFSPMVTRPALLNAINQGDEDGVDELRRVKTNHSLAQLQEMFRDDQPDLIVHDACEDFAGRLFASNQGVPSVRFAPVPVKLEKDQELSGDNAILIGIPRFFIERIGQVESPRVRVVGFIPGGRGTFFEPWTAPNNGSKTILVSVTTGILPQIDFCKMIIDAFRDAPFQVVLSIGGLDRVSKIAPADLGQLPDHFELNRGSANFEILQHAALFVTQGGQGSILEAIYQGVPILGIPSYFWDEDACRMVVDLGLGARLSFSDASPERIREHAENLLDDQAIRVRLQGFQHSMSQDSGAEVAADVIESNLH
jgi:demethyllactenocin mycarosyltransferase